MNNQAMGTFITEQIVEMTDSCSHVWRLVGVSTVRDHRYSTWRCVACPAARVLRKAVKEMVTP
jgi:hypothetical protein